MDELKMVSNFATGLISKLIKKALFKKMGLNIDIDVNSIQFEIGEADVKAHIDAKAKISRDDFASIFSSNEMI